MKNELSIEHSMAYILPSTHDLFLCLLLLKKKKWNDIDFVAIRYDRVFDNSTYNNNMFVLRSNDTFSLLLN